MCVVYLGKRWQQDALWEEVRFRGLVESMPNCIKCKKIKINLIKLKKIRSVFLSV